MDICSGMFMRTINAEDGRKSEPLRVTKASTEIPANTIPAPSHWPGVNECLYTTTDKSIVNSLRVSVMVLAEEASMQVVEGGKGRTLMSSFQSAATSRK